MNYEDLVTAVNVLKTVVQELRDEVHSLRAWNRFLVGLVIGLSLLTGAVLWALHTSGVRLAW